MTKFTPGPWIWRIDGDTGDVYAPSAPEGSRLPAQTFGPDAEANAALIAAAPELLDALETVRALQFDHSEGVRDRVATVVEAVIKKATSVGRGNAALTPPGKPNAAQISAVADKVYAASEPLP